MSVWPPARASSHALVEHLAQECIWSVTTRLKETKIAPADVAEKLMAKNHKIDVDGSLKDLVESLERRKKHQREHGDDHKKKFGGKKLKILSGLFSF